MKTYLAADCAKCAGNPTRQECKTCLRFLLPAHPETSRQVWIAPWELTGSCPAYYPDNRMPAAKERQ